ncbi:uncharacterized protein IAS62_005507 [Cryptococcus decagattii]|uniref:Uncharacterized protein n=1 Tax=Cryptococcus decagattii TaxID=1859122 RepID=A0ABZ2B026_9TREE
MIRQYSSWLETADSYIYIYIKHDAHLLSFPLCRTWELRLSAAPRKVGPWCDHVKNGMEHGLDTSGARKHDLLIRLAGASTIVVPRRDCRKAAERL